MKLAAAILALLAASPAMAERPCHGKYAVVTDVDSDDVVAKEEVIRWAMYALKAEGKYAHNSACVLYIQTAFSPTSANIRNEHGATAFALSTRSVAQHPNAWVVYTSTMGMFMGGPSYRKDQLRSVIEKFISEKVN